MESHISVSEAARTFPEMIERVCSQGDVFIVERAGEPLCRISPVAPPRRTVRDLVDLLSAAPRPDDAFLDAVEELTKNQPSVSEGPWER
jgi:antitoxin (DNA-binding transcriptional repressor) of toxin-antitoxin stability system